MYIKVLLIKYHHFQYFSEMYTYMLVISIQLSPILLTCNNKSFIFCVFAGEIRCYCNEPGCISAGYMCKSPLGMCYSLLSREGETIRTTQGCVDALLRHQQNLCNGDVLEEVRDNRPSEEWPILYCCKNDMCNYKYKDYMSNMDIVMNHGKINSSRHRAGN